MYEEKCPDCRVSVEECGCREAYADLAAAYAPGGRIYEMNKKNREQAEKQA